MLKTIKIYPLIINLVTNDDESKISLGEITIGNRKLPPEVLPLDLQITVDGTNPDQISDFLTLLGDWVYDRIIENN